MAQVLIRNIDDKIIERHRERARENGRSLEAELRDVVSRGAALTRTERVALSDTLLALTATDALSGDSTDIIRWYRDTHGGRWIDETDDRHERSG